MRGAYVRIRACERRYCGLAMSQENVDSFLASTEAVNRRDIAGALRFVDPEIHFEPQLAELQGSYAGRDGVSGFYADVWDTYEVFDIHYSDVRGLDDRVLALGTVRTRGIGSGIEAEEPLAIVVTFRDGLMTHLKDFGSKDQALETVGLQA
jgi:hypothetical protein